MEVLIEIILEFLFYFAVDFVVLALDGGFNIAGRIIRTSSKVIFYILLGFGFGALSLFFWPSPLISRSPSILISLLLLPLIASTSVLFVAKCIEQRWHRELDFDRFSLSYIFVLMFASTRYFYLMSR